MTNPSAIIIALISGFYNTVLNGWVKLNDATINGDGFTINFYRLFERTIDRNCDALNGWYSIKTNKFLCELIVDGETMTMAVDTEEKADKLFEIFKGIKPCEDEEETLTAKEIAKSGFTTLKNFIG